MRCVQRSKLELSKSNPRNCLYAAGKISYCRKTEILIMNKLKIKNPAKNSSNGVTVMNNISSEIGNGMFGLPGPNGAGKSTLMRTIAGLQMPDGGGIYFNRVDAIADLLFIQKQLGYLPQDFGVYPKTSLYNLIDLLGEFNHELLLQIKIARRFGLI